jgi:hypothetical protein
VEQKGNDQIWIAIIYDSSNFPIGNNLIQNVDWKCDKSVKFIFLTKLKKIFCLLSVLCFFSGCASFHKNPPLTPAYIAKDGQKLFHDAVTVLAAPGHTDGHACFEIRSEGESLVHISDVVHHHVLMFDNVGWTVAMDHDPETAVKTRKKLFTRMAKEKSRAFGFHLPWPGLGTVVPKGDQYAWVPERFSWGS